MKKKIPEELRGIMRGRDPYAEGNPYAEGAGLQVFIIKGRGTAAELAAKQEAIHRGDEKLPDGSRYREDRHDVRVLWTIVGGDPFEPGYFKGSKQLLDIILRPVEKEDLNLLPADFPERQEIEIAISGGLNSIELTFEEKKILHAIEAAFADASGGGRYPDQIKLSRAELYDYLGVRLRARPDGSLYRAEGSYTRKRIDKTLLTLSDKPFPFVFKMKSGKVDKKTGEPLWTVALTRAPIIKVARIFEDVRQRELPGIIRRGDPEERRFSHYKIRLNKNAVGEIEHYFRYLPRLLAKSISDYRSKIGGRATSAELNFIEYLFAESRERIEINFIKLAKKLKIKKTETHPKEVRQSLRRCYETAKALGYVLQVEEDAPGLRDTKDIIHLNPARFLYIKRLGKGSREGSEGAT